MMGQCMEMMAGMGGMMGGMGGMMGGGMLGSLLSTLLVLALAVGGAALLLRSRAPQRVGARGSAVALLDERFARGEIDADDYQERRRLLQR